mmetsp:Transcript_24767/g.41892  ORF Transcript_24767/g.41892 Transcript_24767/m.41892 type:complete len:222 (-) Transcript_24767:43-708(-)
MADNQAFTRLDIVVISFLVFLIWSLIMVVGYYVYQVFYLDDQEDGQHAELDDSTKSTSELIGNGDASTSTDSNRDHGNGEYDWIISARDAVSLVFNRMRSDVHEYFYNSTYDLNRVVDRNKKVLIETTVMKGDLGIGLDIKKKNELIEVTGFKKFPSWTSNPAQMCNPPILEGDFIVGVNNTAVKSFDEAVKVLKDLPNGDVTLHLRRTNKSMKKSKRNAL